MSIELQKNKEEISIRDMKLNLTSWINHLKSKWRFVILFSVLCGMIGFALSFIIPKSYIANLTFVLAGNDRKMAGISSLVNQFGFSAGSSEGMFQENDNIIDLFLSRTMIVRTLLEPSNEKNKLLADNYLVASGLANDWKRNERLSGIRFINYSEGNKLLYDSILNILYKQIVKQTLIVSTPNPKSEILAITVKSIDEFFSKTFAEKLLDNVSEFYIDCQTKKSQNNVNILRHQVDSIRAVLNSAILGVATSVEVNPNINQAYKRLLVPTQKRTIDVEMNKSILVELVKNLEMAELLLRKDTPLFLVIDRPILPLDYKSITKIEGIIEGIIIGTILILLYFSLRLYLNNLSI